MNYLAIFMLVIVVFFSFTKKQVKKMEEKLLSQKDLEKIQHVKENVLYITTNGKSREQIQKEIKEASKEYIILSKTEKIENSIKDNIIYNFILSDSKPCGFNVRFYYNNTPSRLKNIFMQLIAACINYIQMLKKEDIYSYYFVCAKKEDISSFNKSIQDFELSEYLSQSLTEIRLKEYILKRERLSISDILNFFFVILAGTVVTANVLYNLNAVITFRASIYNVIACALIYVCYANILSKVYSPMGRYRFIASYLFPIYIVVYIILTAYYYIRKAIGGFMMNKKKNFFISLIILLVIYVIFILIKR